MPYYTEIFENSVKPVQYRRDSTIKDGRIVLDSVEMTGFRSRPHPNAISSKEIIMEQSIDPYAYFLESNTQKEYQARLKERGLEPEGEPDRGHPLELIRHTWKGPLNNIAVSTQYPFVETRYNNGFLYPYAAIANDNLNSVHNGSIFGPATYKETGLDAFAQKAYSRSAPTAVEFDAATFLGELREGLPRLVPDLAKAFTGKLRAAGSDYLNIEFGWKPFIKDIQGAAKALMGATNSLSNMGKRVHRRYSLPPTEQYDQRILTNVPANVYVLDSWGVSDRTAVYHWFSESADAFVNVTGLYSKRRVSERWFEGEFTHFLPIGFDPNDYFQRLSVLMNPKITPATLWELAPWSWLIDWNLNIQDTIASNQLAANDQLIMHYGYAMERTRYQTGLSFAISQEFPYERRQMTGHPQKSGFLVTTEYKRRLRANPYGFQAGGAAALTGNQSAILGALGLTRLR